MHAQVKTVLATGLAAASQPAFSGIAHRVCVCRLLPVNSALHKDMLLNETATRCSRGRQ